jgi:hypothetical protein
MRHVSSRPGLLGKVVPLCLLLMEEPGFVPATSSDTLKRRPVSKIRKHKNTRREKKARERIRRVPASRNKDLA